jgi:hypothetical protein
MPFGLDGIACHPVRRARLLTGRVCAYASNWMAMDGAVWNGGRHTGPSGDGPLRVL